MKIQATPDFLIFADESKTGELTDFPNIARGWGVTIDQTQGKPSMEWMNGAFNRIDKNILYLLQQGVPEWNASVLYPVNAIIKYNGNLYIALLENDNAKPSTNTSKWVKFLKDASTTQKGIVQLSSNIDSESETEAATIKAVKTIKDALGGYLPATKYNDTYSVSDLVDFATRPTFNESDLIAKSDYTYSTTSSGTVLKRPDGLIIQFGSGAYNAGNGSSGTVILLPTRFPKEFLFVIGSDGGDGCCTLSTSVNDLGSLRCWGRLGATYTNASLKYIAIGR